MIYGFELIQYLCKFIIIIIIIYLLQ